MEMKSKRIAKLRSLGVHLLYTTLAVVLLLLFFWSRIFVTVSAGEAGVMWRRFSGGVSLNRVYGEGIHFVFPWDRLTVYNTRLQTEMVEMTALSQNGLPVQLSVAIRYKPDREFLPLLHQTIGPDYFDVIISPEVRSTIRAQMGVLTEDEIYANKLASLHVVTDQATGATEKRYVHLDVIRLTQVKLPAFVTQAIEEKMIEKEKLESYRFLNEQASREAERLEIQAGGISKYNNIVDASLTGSILQWKGIEATLELATSPNAKLVMMGNGNQGLPVILNAGDFGSSENDVTPQAARLRTEQAMPPVATNTVPLRKALR